MKLKWSEPKGTLGIRCCLKALSEMTKEELKEVIKDPELTIYIKIAREFLKVIEQGGGEHEKRKAMGDRIGID